VWIKVNWCHGSKIPCSEPIQAIIHKYMETSHRHSLYSYLKQTKMPFFFSFTNSENRAEQVLSGGVGTSGKGQDVRKGGWRVNMVQILYTHVCKWKNETS
jgi:hypothetical protein